MRIEKILFLVKRPGQYIDNVIVDATDREYAKRHAKHILGGNPDQYIVTPLTEPGERIAFLLGED